MIERRYIFSAGLVILAAILILVAGPLTSKVHYFSSTRDIASFLDKSTDNAYATRNTLQAGGAQDAKEASAPNAPSPESSSTSYSTTNIQVEGVDEPDFVKNDGTYIYLVQGSDLIIIEATPAENERILSTTHINGTLTHLFVKGDTLVVFGSEDNPIMYATDDTSTTSSDAKMAITRPAYYQQRSFARVYTVEDRTAPELKEEFVYDGTYYDARMIDTHVYLITNQALLRDETGTVKLPTISSNGAQTTLTAREIAYFPVQDYGYQLTTVFAFNLDNPTEEPTRSSFLTGYTQTLYVSEKNIYLTAPKYISYDTYEQRLLEKVLLPGLSNDNQDKAQETIKNTEIHSYEKQQVLQTLLADQYNRLTEEQKRTFEQEMQDRFTQFEENWREDNEKTTIIKLAIDNDKVTYAAQSEVPGYPLNQFSMDEHNGYVRIATTSNRGFGMPMPLLARVSADDPALLDKKRAAESEPLVLPQPQSTIEQTNALYVLDQNLKIVGSLEHIAPNEAIYAARFIGERAYLVTFKQIDPLFVVDLTDPTNPKILGELKIPGFSNYLHSYDENTLIGIGQDTEGEIEEGNGVMAAIPAGLKIALFDVRDPAHPREIDRYVIGDRGTSSDALYDHKAFLFNPKNGLLVIPITVQEKIEAPNPATPEEQLWYPTRTSFEGAYVFSLDANKGFTLKNKITHLTQDERAQLERASDPSKGYYYPSYETHIRRSLYIGTTLYTISQRAVRATSLEDYRELFTLDLPQPEMSYGWAAAGTAGTGGTQTPPTEVISA